MTLAVWNVCLFCTEFDRFKKYAGLVVCQIQKRFQSAHCGRLGIYYMWNIVSSRIDIYIDIVSWYVCSLIGHVNFSQDITVLFFSLSTWMNIGSPL